MILQENFTSAVEEKGEKAKSDVKLQKLVRIVTFSIIC